MGFAFSAKIVLGKIKKDGTAPIYLQVIINRKVEPINLMISWPPNFFDRSGSYCLPREKNDQQARDNNLLIRKKLGKANEVEGWYRWHDQVPTIENFLANFHTEGSRNDFIDYYEKKLAYRTRKKLIKGNTIKNHTNTLNKLKSFRPQIPFNSLEYTFAEEFEIFLYQNIKPRNKKKASTNTIWGHQRDIMTYMEFARKDKFVFENPYEDYVNKSVEGTWLPLKPNELKALEFYYSQLTPGTIERIMLQKFLFSCHSSLRVSDLNTLEQAQLQEGILIFKPCKTFHKNEKLLHLPLTDKALGYLADSKKENLLFGFVNGYTDQFGNRILKRIAEKLEISTEVHWHVGRETFGTEFIRKGGKVEVLQKLMDHDKIETTMKYVHIYEEMKVMAIHFMNKRNKMEELNHSGKKLGNSSKLKVKLES